jgi:hypothetical protein
MADAWDEFAPIGRPDPATPAPAAEPRDPWDEFAPGGRYAKKFTPVGSAGRGFMQGATLGFGDEIVGGSPVVVSPVSGMPVTMPSREWVEDPKAARQEGVRAEREDDAAAREQNPKSFVTGEVLGGVATAPLAPQLKGITIAQRLKNAAKVGAVYGGVTGAGQAETMADVPVGVGTGAVFGAAAGPAVQLGLEGAGAALRATKDAALRSIWNRLRVQPTAAARKLTAQGVPLTVGQMEPESTLGLLERVSADHPFGMAPQRTAAQDAFQRVAQNKGVAPGATPPESTNLQGRLKELLEGFGPAYDTVRGAPISPDAVAGLPAAASMPGRGVDARTAAGVKAEVENALTVIGLKPPAAPHAHGGAPPAKPQGLVDQFGREIPPAPKPPPKATAGDLLKVRENIRENIRAARVAQDFDRLRLLEGAEDTVTEAIDSALSPELSEALRATDKQYARLMTATNAAPAGQTNFTPLQYLKQVERSAGRRNFKTGEAGDLQDLGEAAREVFTNAPMTGFRAGALSTLPGAKYWGAPVSRFANTEAGRAFLLNPPRASPVGSDVSVKAAAGVNAMDSEVEAFLAWLRAKAGYPQAGLAPGAAEEPR